MAKLSNTPQSKITQIIQKILNDKHLTKQDLALFLDIDDSNVARLLSDKSQLTYNTLAKIADFLAISVIDIITYPDKFVPVTKSEDEPLEAVLQIKLKKDKKDQVLNLIFGEHNLEILEK